MNESHMNFTSCNKSMSNVFSMHDISACNVQIMNELMLMISISKS
jgi:hypothetical protein